jgi:rubrerythrin
MGFTYDRIEYDHIERLLGLIERFVAAAEKAVEPKTDSDCAACGVTCYGIPAYSTSNCPICHAEWVKGAERRRS